MQIKVDDKWLQEDKTLGKLQAEGLHEQCKAMLDLEAEIDRLGEVKSKLQKVYDSLRLNIIPDTMESTDGGINTVTYADVGRVTITAGISVSIPAEVKPAAMEWLDLNGHGGLITSTVNSQSLSAAMKRRIQSGDEVPESLFTVRPFTRAAITKLS